MPRYDRVLSNQAQSALGIVKAGEIASASGGPAGKEWTALRLEALYELAYLRVFATWEMCLEAVFYRSLCGYASAAGQETLVSGTYYRNLAAADAAVLAGQPYRLWHSPQKVIDRCQQFIVPSLPGGVLERAMASNITRLTHLASTRHRIVHDHQADAKRKFDAATLQIAGRTYPGSRPGKFLRDYAPARPRRRWLDVAITDLTALMGQIV